MLRRGVQGVCICMSVCVHVCACAAMGAGVLAGAAKLVTVGMS